MDKQQIISAIQEQNPTAKTEFLDAFGVEQLESYLCRLRQLKDQRGNQTCWVRPTGSPPVTMRKAA